ncbi:MULTISPECIES: fumarylacetoacetate hydrolase family protein [unclassified Pseudoalteromonas]|uniref:fumarylacetoacetate hydrolase family protein n=1 Tax=unclassified Pseudoalteromonas TaxID=194690 RepID=UPI000C07238B|nr:MULTISPECIES: fumarylacetoacetate hydrolase family protein [unclassified Pseudoalteromonas]MDP2634390.1 fumarylacetoacetate hydrolase family protein [Pseudoalteromonas sp. 1_MG-2023]PHN89290.1 2-keto-4-pentenoate hydratase [Pseudoalteromonas sp. 3D05]
MTPSLSLAPSKIVCVGRNYVDHINELGNQIADQMVVFNKPNTAIATQLLSEHNGEPLHFETEICFKIQQGRLAEVGVGLDLTKRDLQSKLKAKGLPWERAKAFDGSALFSHFVPIEQDDIAGLNLSLSINDHLQQQGNVELMLYKPSNILTQISEFMTLNDGDIIMTGTPAGVGRVIAGDAFKASIMCADQLLIEVSWLAV